MIADISEFSYGFALTNEIVGWSGLRVAPIFPSLIEEGKKGGGYDVKLEMPGVPLYLQFKRSDCMLRRTAREIRDLHLPLTTPFYRFAVTQATKSQQHKLLLELDDGVSEVYYAAPRFHELAEINSAWSTHAVADRSIFVRPQEIGNLDDQAHHVSFDGSHTYVCSEPKRIRSLSVLELRERLGQLLATDSRSLRAKLPELVASLDQAWGRGQERNTKLTSSDHVLLADSQEAVRPRATARIQERVETRQPSPIDEARRPLRQLADSAAERFNAQLVIVQNDS